MFNYAPIGLFVYNRPFHTNLTVKALLQNTISNQSDLWIFSDAPKNENSVEKVEEVRRLIRSITGFKNIYIVERSNNYGISKSIIDGVGMLCDKYGHVIVIEDDIVTSPHFLQFINDGLQKYKNYNEVASIHGYQYPIRNKLPETFFLKGADCWGWATWKRAWNYFEPDGISLLESIRKFGLVDSFNMDGAYKYTDMLEDQIAGRNDSWAVRWHASCFINDMLTLYPGHSLVHNIGNDGTGIHCGHSQKFGIKNLAAKINVNDIKIEENLRAKTIISSFLKPSKSKIFMYRFRNLINKL